jgi:hypothetical protein
MPNKMLAPALRTGNVVMKRRIFVIHCPELSVCKCLMQAIFEGNHLPQNEIP